MIFPRNNSTLHAGRLRYGRTAWFWSALVLLSFAASAGWTETTPRITRDAHVERRSSDGPVDVTIHVDRTSAQIADKIRLTLTVQSPDGVQIYLPPPVERLGEFDVISVAEQPDIPVEGGRVWTRTYELESLVSGDQTVPAITIAYVDSRRGASVQGEVRTEPVTVSISSLLEGQRDPTQYRDIKGTVEVSPPAAGVDPRYSIIATLAAAVLAAGISVHFLLAGRRREWSPREWALAELGELESQVLADELTADQFYTGATDIVRRYVERQFGIDAPRLTTAEFFSRITSRSFVSDDQQQLLREFLETADLVKFAGLLPAADSAAAATARARRFIEDSSEAARDDRQKPPGKEVA